MTDPKITVKLNELVQKGKGEIEACQQAVNQLSLVVKQNTDRVNRNSALEQLQSTDRIIFSRLRSEYNDYVRDWENTRGDFSRFNKKDFQDRFWSRECWGKSGGWTGDIQPSDWHCGNEAQDKGYPDPWSWKATGDKQGCRWDGGIESHKTFKCARSDSSINTANKEWQDAKPKFSDWMKNKNKNPGLAECRKSNWQCILKSDNSNQGSIRIGWGHTEGDAGWACNNWRVGRCNGDTCRATEIQDIEGKPGPVCKDGEANINWEKDTNDRNYPDNSQYPYNNQEPKFPQVQCCTNINAVAGTAQNIAQTCQQTLIQAENELDKPGSTSGSPPVSGSPPSAGSPPSSGSPPASGYPPAAGSPSASTSTNSTAIIGIIVLVILLFGFSCSSGLMAFMFMGDE